MRALLQLLTPGTEQGVTQLALTQGSILIGCVVWFVLSAGGIFTAFRRRG